MSRIAPPLAFSLALAIVLAPAALVSVSAQPLPRAVSAEGDITWSVEPIQTGSGVRRAFEYEVDPGTQIVDSVVITNAGETSAEFLIYATDAINELESGAFGLLERDDPPTDSGSWITLASDKLTIDPGMQAIVPFNLLVPSDATPGDHVAGVVASVITQGESDGAAVELEQRVGARVYLSISGEREAAVELQGVSTGFRPELNPFAPGTVGLNYTVLNTGNVRMDVNQAVKVTGPFGIPLGEYTPEPLSELLPRQRVQVVTEIPSIAALFLAFSNITVVPGELGSAGTAVDSEVGDASTTDAPTPEATAESTGEATAAPEGEAGAEVETPEEPAIEYVAASESVWTFAISWTLLAIIVVLIAGVYFVARYVSGTRERMYLAIDEAAAAAREEALAGGVRTDSAER